MFRVISVLILFALINGFDGAFRSSRKAHDAYKLAYYDPKTGIPLKGEFEGSTRRPFTKIGFRGLPCDCNGPSCGCCAGVNLPFNIQRACTNVTLNPYELSIRMEVSVNDLVIYSRELSARNPPALCMPMPYVPGVNFCVRFYDVHFEERNLHACIDFETRVVNAPILALHFNCVKLGAGGISWTKPTNQNLLLPEVSVTEVYDFVNFEVQDLEGGSNATTTLSPEEEANIGQLKLR